MRKTGIIFFVILVTLLAGSSLVSASSPAAKIVSGVVTNVVSAVFKWLWSLKSTPKSAIPSRSMMRFESGYNVETVFDGSKLGIEPYSLEVLASGEVLVLDSENSNIYKMSSPLSRYSRPKLVAGSAEGYTGHVDGKPREARMSHPKGLTVDDRGNIYVADTMNMAIRKITDSGVMTIAGGKSNRGGGHVDGPSEDAKFSNDFDLLYVGSSCSLLVIDRGNQAIREIALREDDCSWQYEEGNLHLGIAVLASAVFFGYMLALLQRRISGMLLYDNDPKAYIDTMPPAPYQRPPPKSVRPPLIPSEDEYEKQEDGIFSSLGRLLVNSFFEIFKRKPSHQASKPGNSNSWPLQESYVIPHEDEPPPITEANTRKSYTFMTRETQKKRQQQVKQSQSYYGDYHLRHLQHHVSHPRTFYEHENGEMNEIVFGAVQEHEQDQDQDWRRDAVTIKAVDYGEASASSEQNMRSRYKNMSSYSYGY